MSTQDIVQKLWNLCNVLRDDGITYHQYVTELTYILFLKMADETGADKDIPEVYRWGSLTSRSGIDLKKHYYTLLSKLGEESVGRVAQIYANASSSIEEPKNLEKIITEIDKLDWYEAKEEGLGDLYEGLLEKNANEKKSGAGQYFTPRVLIDVMTELIKPQLGDKCFDPACGTFGFMIAANRYVNANNDMYALSDRQADFQQNKAFNGVELVHETHRLALMNAYLHNMNANITLGDSLAQSAKGLKDFDEFASYLSENGLLGGANIGNFISVEDEFYIFDIAFFQNMFAEGGFVSELKEIQKVSIQKEAEQQVQGLNRGQQRNKTLQKQVRDIVEAATSKNEEEYKSAEALINMLASIIPYPQILCISNYLVVLNEKYLRDNISTAAFKYGGKVKVVGYITNKVMAQSNTHTSAFAEIGASINALMKIFFENADEMFVVHPVAIYYDN